MHDICTYIYKLHKLQNLHMTSGFGYILYMYICSTVIIYNMYYYVLICQIMSIFINPFAVFKQSHVHSEAKLVLLSSWEPRPRSLFVSSQSACFAMYTKFILLLAPFNIV